MFIVLSMVFLHIIADYNLQGWLAQAKQKSWWKQNAPAPMYRYDYFMALAMHCISWSFLILFPIAWAYDFHCGWRFLVAFAINAAVHGYVDDLKANKLRINLIVDQLLHLIQIGITAAVMLS